MSQASKFRSLLTGEGLEFICEAHNALSAKIVEQAGFRGIWASGLSISAQWGVRDSNEASWTQILDHLEFMADAVNIPILLDGDTGYGNYNNARRLVRKLEMRGIAAVCFEDKLFPKTNSFINGTRQQLAEIEEFAGKIRAAKDAQTDTQFSVVARIEAFIAGWGLEEALRRAEAYQAAGADAILIHSGRSVPDEILQFLDAWGNRCPVVLVPTKYFKTPTEVFRDRRVSVIIWANHLLRSSIVAMQSTAEDLARDQSLVNVEPRVAPLAEVFRLQEVAELQQSDARYLPHHESVAAVILAATRGEELSGLTQRIPKTMLPIGSRTVLDSIVASLRSSLIGRIVVVGGWFADRISADSIEVVANEHYSSSREIDSLLLGVSQLEDHRGPIVIAYGDVPVRPSLIASLLDYPDEITIVVDPSVRPGDDDSARLLFARTSMPHGSQSFFDDILLTDLLPAALSHESVNGAWPGVLYVPTTHRGTLRRAIEAVDLDSMSSGSLSDVINRIVFDGNEIRVVYSIGGWVDVNSFEDYLRAQGLK